MWESCAIIQYLCNKHHLDKFYPTEPEKRTWWPARCSISAIYLYLARATYGALNFPQYLGEVGASDASPAVKEKEQNRSARRSPRSTSSFPPKTFVGGDHPPIADIA
jgi:glutathione S-transferase